MPKLANEKDCTGCLACVDACKHQSIKVFKKNGHNFVTIVDSKCIDCKLCEKSCPIVNPINYNKNNNLSIYGGWCNDINLRNKSASGGAFTALALDFIDKNGEVIGATLNYNSVKHICINNKKDLLKIQNSKYIQSNTQGIYIQVKKFLIEGKMVLFSGTPCQVAALNSFLRKKYENLITIDLICNGIPSEDALMSFIEQNSALNVVSFRDKTYGWNSLKSQSLSYNNNNKIYKTNRETDIFYQIFSTGITHRRICCHCPFSKLPRIADITIADFWGIKRFEEEWKDGISLIIANNSKGDKVIKDSKYLHIFESTLEECVKANPRLINGKKYHEYHPIMLFPSLKKILPKNIYSNIIQNKMPYKLFWAPFKILTILSNKKRIKTTLKNEKNRYNNNI